MIIRPGDICLIDLHTKSGPKSAKALMVESKDSTVLWLLIYARIPSLALATGDKIIQSYRGRSIKEFGYSPICKGNLFLTEINLFQKYLGSISIHQLGDVCCDVFVSSEAWKLSRLRNERPSGVNFWINLNPPIRDNYHDNQSQIQN